jgi:hypothetical protein
VIEEQIGGGQIEPDRSGLIIEIEIRIGDRLVRAGCGADVDTVVVAVTAAL